MSTQYTNQEIEHFVRLGFCKPKSYKPSVWKEAKVFMTLACAMNIGVEHQPHRGGGEYWIIDQPKEVTIDSIIWAMIQKHGDPLNPFIVKERDEKFRVYDTETGQSVDRFYDSIEDANLVAKNHNLFRRDRGVAV